MPVPIEKIAEEKLHLTVLQGHRITSDFSILGEICFSDSTVKLQDIFKCGEKEVTVTRGTILIDAYTYWQRNQGATNNTIAHEVYHWYRHRLYAAIKQILRNEKFIAHRCPLNITYPGKNEKWSDEQRMEWQANNIAPRILMPLKTFRMKVNELYLKYDYENTPLKIVTLTCIADDLAKFFKVSRQSALIRMMEAGYKEAISVYNYDESSNYHAYVSPAEAFYEYSTNPAFKKLVDSNQFKYVDSYFVLNDSKYITQDETGNYALTDYAWEHISECTLQFSWQKIKQVAAQTTLPFEILHRTNDDRQLSRYEAKPNEAVLQLSDELRRKREEFEKQQSAFKITAINKSCWQVIFEIISARGISKSHFCNATLLGEEVYRKAETNTGIPKLRTIVAIACGLDLDIGLTEKLLQLAGHAFNESTEHQALRFCITGLSGHSIEDRNAFLESYGYEPLGSKQRK